MDRRRFGHGELVTADTTKSGTLDDKLNLTLDDIESSANERIRDHHPYGVITGLEVVQNSPANMTVKVNAGTADDQNGARIEVPSQQSVDPLTDYQDNAIALPTLGNEKYVSVFLKFKRLNQDAAQDDNSVAYYQSELESFEIRVRAGSEAPSGTATPPALRGSEILLADILLTPGMTTITTSDIELLDRRQDAWNLAPTNALPKQIRVGNAKAAVTQLLSWLNDLLDGDLTLDTLGITHLNGSEKFAGSVNPPSDGDLRTWLRALITMLGKTTSTVGADLIGNSTLGTWADSSSAGSANGIGVQFRAVVAALAASTGAAKMGMAAVGNFTAGTMQAMIAQLAATTASNDGAKRIATQSQSGSPDSLSGVTTRAQLDELLVLVNARTRKGATETITAAWTFQNQIIRSGTAAVDRWRETTLTDADSDITTDFDIFYLPETSGPPGSLPDRILTLKTSPTPGTGARVRIVHPANRINSAIIRIQGSATDLITLAATQAPGGWSSAEWSYNGTTWRLVGLSGNATQNAMV